jgi:hypothetical protein
MKIILHNPSHNGDQLHTLGIVKRIIEDNPGKEFLIVPACSMYLFNDLLNDNVKLDSHPVIWDNDKNVFLSNNFISNNHNILWNIHEGDIYINMWKLLIEKNHNCIGMVNRELVIKEILLDIHDKTGVNINFTCDNYKDLMPILPRIDISNIHQKIKSYNKQIIFFFNQNSKCGFEGHYPININEETIQKLINKYGDDSIILLTKPTAIVHESIIVLEEEFNMKPVLDGKNLIMNANIANLADEVYFKTNGGSLFILNQVNIEGSKNKTKYNFIGTEDFYNVINSEYDLSCRHIYPDLSNFI